MTFKIKQCYKKYIPSFAKKVKEMVILVAERKSFEVKNIRAGRWDYVRITERGSGYSVAIEILTSSIRWL